LLYDSPFFLFFLTFCLSARIIVHSLFLNNCDTEPKASKHFAAEVGAMHLPYRIRKTPARAHCSRKARIPSKSIETEW
jgi:hypothetical protein